MATPEQNKNPHNSPKGFTVRLRAGQPADDTQVRVEFQLAPETQSVGLPGKQPGDLLLRQNADGSLVVMVSLGTAAKCSPEAIRRAGGALGKWLVDKEITHAGLDLDSLRVCETEGAAAALCEGIKLGAYKFNRYKKDSGNAAEIHVILQGGDADQNQALAERVEAVTGAVIMARDLSHEPANVINPVTLAEYAQNLAQQYGLTCRVLDENQLAELGAGAILAVGQGSQTPPRLIILEYPGQAEAGAQPVVVVGKAITFDTGGYSIKDTTGIVGMKYDKCGGVNVLGIMQAAAELKLKTPLVGIIGAAENMISSRAYRPDDILRTMNGKTVEIISTDAEGRLVLADALAYAQKNYQPRALIDLATLTGGVIVALGRVRAALLCNDDSLASQLFEAGEKTHERLWRLPLDEDYSRNMKGDDADLKNSGGREGHCILGGAFIQEFVDPGTPWAHLDIAGVAETPKDLPYAPKGATGFGIRLLIAYLENLA
jgi:leucyl aminopeptidase